MNNTDLRHWCEHHRKVKYRYAAQALDMVEHRLKKGDANYLRIYKCPECRQWHLTSHEYEAVDLLEHDCQERIPCDSAVS